MPKILSTYLMITGIGAFVALAMPSLVAIGFFLLVIPGLILSLMPTAFLYGVIFTAAWLVARGVLGDSNFTWIVALVATATVLFAVTQPTRIRDWARYRSSLLGEVVPAGPVELRGHVRFDLRNPKLNPKGAADRRGLTEKVGYACNGHCLAALFMPGVTHVTIDRSEGAGLTGISLGARTYRLEPATDCKANARIEWSDIRPPLAKTNEEIDRTKAAWTMALASEYCLVMEPATDEADVTIVEAGSFDDGESGHWSFGPRALRTNTIEIYEGDELVRRAHSSSTFTLLPFLFIAFDGPLERLHFAWGRTPIPGRRSESADLASNLREFTNLAGVVDDAGPADTAATIPALRARIGAALDDPATTASDPAFELVRHYADAIRSAPEEDDAALAMRLVADRRLTDVSGVGSVEFSFDQRRAIYDAYTRRLLEDGSPPEMANSGIGVLVKRHSADSRALIGPLQEQMLGDMHRRMAVPELVRALGHGEGGEAGRLLTILRTHAAEIAEIQRQRSFGEISRYGRQTERDAHVRVVEAAKSGLCLIADRSTMNWRELDTFLQSGGMPEFMLSGNRMTDWNVTLVRMGKPIDAVQKPEKLSGTVAGYRSNLADKVERWGPDRC